MIQKMTETHQCYSLINLKFPFITLLVLQTFAGRKFREFLGINFRECPITTHFAFVHKPAFRVKFSFRFFVKKDKEADTSFCMFLHFLQMSNVVMKID